MKKINHKQWIIKHKFYNQKQSDNNNNDCEFEILKENIYDKHQEAKNDLPQMIVRLANYGWLKNVNGLVQ